MFYKRLLARAVVASATVLSLTGVATAACEVTGGTATTFSCGDTGVNVRVDSGTDVTLDVTNMTIAGTNDNTGYITYRNNTDVPANLTLNIEGTSINSPAYLGVYAATGVIGPDAAPGDLTITIDEASSITAWDAGVFVRAELGGDIQVTNSADIFAGSTDGGLSFGGVGINATSNGGAVTLTNYGDVTSYSGWGLYADGGYVSGAGVVSIHNEGTVESQGVGQFTDAVRAIAGGSFGTDAEVTNSGTITGTDRRGIVAWSQSGDATIVNTGDVTSKGGQAILGSATAGKVTVTNSGRASVEVESPLAEDQYDTSFAGIEAGVSGTGDVEVKNLENGMVTSHENGIYAHTGSGDVSVSNDGAIIAGEIGILSESAGGDVTITNRRAVFADGFRLENCNCEDDFAGAVTVRGTTLGTVTITNAADAAIAADMALAMLPEDEWLDDLSYEVTSNIAVYVDAEAESVTVANHGTIVGGIAISGTGEGELGEAQIDNRGLWIFSGLSGISEARGTIDNSGTVEARGASLLYGQVNNSGDIVVTALADAPEGLGSGMLMVYGDYAASGDARLILDWPDESMVGLAPALVVYGQVTGETEIVLARSGMLDEFDWQVQPSIAVAAVAGETTVGEGRFYMAEQGYGLLRLSLDYTEGTEGEVWSLVYDTTSGAEALTEIPFAARNLFRLATEGVTDRLEELRSRYAATGGSGAPLGYAPVAEDPVTAALAMTPPAGPSAGAWMRSTGRYGEGDGYSATSGLIEAGIDAQFDLGGAELTAGAFAGTGATWLRFDLPDTDATLSGPVLGGYANYSSDRVFVGVIGAVQALDVDATLMGAAAEFGGLSYGGRVDAGYRFGDELVIEPGVALAASHTAFDSFEMNAMEVGFVDTDSLSAEARLRISRDLAFGDVTVTPFAVATVGNEFLGGDGVDASMLGTTMGSNSGLFGDMSAGVTVANAAGTLSGFARGNVGYAAGEVSGGVRVGASAGF